MTRTVALRCRPEAAGRWAAELELRGELPHWQWARPLRPAGAGWFEAELSLSPGVYEYKLVAPDGSWWLDGENARTRSSGGQRNNLVVVGGADEPVLHAPSAPWVERSPEGALRLRAALRRGAGESLSVRWDEGAGAQQSQMRRVADEDEHSLWEADLPGAGRAVEYGFLLDDGRLVAAGGQLLRVELRELPQPLPEWWRDAVLYSIFVDRFRRGGAAGDGGAGGEWSEPGRWDRDYRAGGDLAGVIEALPHLVDLGVTAVVLTPIARAPSPHRYDVVDPFQVDEALGGEAALEKLLGAAGLAGLRVLLDVTVTHVHRDAAPFRDVRERGPRSPYWPWFRARRFPFHEGEEPGYEHYQKGQWQEPLLAAGDEAVQEHLVQVFEHWARRGVHGFRVDAAADVPEQLCARIVGAVRAIRHDAVVYGEVVPRCIERWTTGGALDAATDFAARARVVDFVDGVATAASVAAEAERLRFRRGHEPGRRVVFTGSHDQPRLLSVVGDARAARLGHLLQLMGAGVPLLYYGDEVGLRAETGAASAARDFEDSWPDRQCMPWAAEAWDGDTLALVRAAARLRADREVLRRGDEETRAATAPDGSPLRDVLLLRRRLGRQVIDVLVHRGDGEARVALPPGAGEPWPLLVVGEAAVAGGRGGVARLGPWSAVVLDRSLPVLDGSGDAMALAAANAALAERAFRDGLVDVPSYPVKLYLTVTEACNLRCAHCITDAPRLTRAGRDRTMRPWLVDALAEPLAHADYLAFTHGGESLVAPIFFELLARFARERGRRPGRADVHLVSNGMLLDEARAQRLMELGLTSLMVSIDGASAAVNDRMRVGGSLERVLANVKALLRARDAAGVDLRVGLSSVIGRGNLHEVEALAQLAASLGVDWLKLEETYPATPTARLDLVHADDPALGDAVARAAERLGGSGVVLVDHTDPPPGCGCDGDTRALDFRAADDFANRADLRPCRAPWTQACVDPDGTLRPVSYAQPALGRVGSADFLALWNAPAARALRSSARSPGCSCASPPTQ